VARQQQTINGHSKQNVFINSFNNVSSMTTPSLRRAQMFCGTICKNIRNTIENDEDWKTFCDKYWNVASADENGFLVCLRCSPFLPYCPTFDSGNQCSTITICDFKQSK
jgi:hypothetical protein